MFNRPGIWTWARIEKREEQIDVRVWVADERGIAPSAVDVFGAILKLVHIAAGGDPERSSGLVSMTVPAPIAIPGGTVSAAQARPTADDARAVVDKAWEGVEATARSLVGALGTVTSNTDFVELSYGPGAAVGTIAAAPQRFVELSVVCRPASRPRFGG